MARKTLDAKAMFDTAEAFTTSSRLMESYRDRKIRSGSTKNLYYDIAPIISNHAFAIELYLKCISVIEKGDFNGDEHKFTLLFLELSQQAREKIKLYHQQFVSKNKALIQPGRRLPPMDIESVLKQCENAFIKFRYMPEQGFQTYNAKELNRALQKYILEIKPKWNE